ncbi:MAG: PucR family transcriptional regulator, partial [Candidatus Dormibacteria bacterium]
RVFSEPGPVYVEALAPDILPRAAVAVRAGDEVLGSIWAAVKGPPTAEQDRALADAAQFVALHMLRHQVAADAHRGLEADLVSAVLTGGSLANEASRRLGLSGAAYRVVAVGLGDGERADRDIQLARCRNLLGLQLSAIHRGVPTAQLGGVVYAVVPSARAGTTIAPLRQLLEQYVKRAAAVVRTPVLVGIGSQVESIAGIPRSRQTADKVLRVLNAEPGLGVAEMEDVRASALLMDFAAAYAGDPALEGGPAGALQAYDVAHRTNYTETLEAYLDAFGDMDAAATALDVHANTVRYRLRQLKRIVDLHLDDPSQRLALMLQLRLLRAARG